MKCVDMMMRNGDMCADYAKIIDRAAQEYKWDSEDIVLVEQAIVRKMRKFAKEEGREKLPILELMNKKMTSRERERAIKYLERVGWDYED